MATKADSTPEDWARVAIEWSQRELEPRCDVILSEVFIATNFNTGDTFMDPEVEDRNYPELPGFLPGTCDLVCILSGPEGELLVADWKTGGGSGVWEQLMSLAYGLSRSPFLRKPDGSIRKVRIAALYAGQESMGGGGILCIEKAVPDSELVSFAKAMAFQMANVGLVKEHVQGSHCTQLFCPHLAYCDAVMSDVAQAARQERPELFVERGMSKTVHLPNFTDNHTVLTDTPSSDEEAGLVMARIAAARRQMKYYEAGIREYVDNGGRAIDGDWEYKQTPTGYRWVKFRGQ